MQLSFQLLEPILNNLFSTAEKSAYVEDGTGACPGSIEFPKWLPAATLKIRKSLELSLLANHFPALHGIRVIAVLSVVQIHTTLGLLENGLISDSGFSTFSRNIFFGMDLFFILSGFLIGMLLLHSDKKTSRSKIARFYVRRGFRTFPLYYVVLALLAITVPLNAAQQSNAVREIFYFSNYGYSLPLTRIMAWGWSLSVEEHFYLAAPIFFALICLLRSHSARIVVMLMMWLLGLGIRLVVFYGHEGPWNSMALFQQLYIRTHTRFDVFVAGVLLAYLQYNFQDQLRAFVLTTFGRFLCRTLALACLVVLLLTRTMFPSPGLFSVFAWGTLTSLMYVPFLILILNTTGPLCTFLSHRFFLMMATLGYGIYLVHIPLGLMIRPVARIALSNYGLPIEIVWPMQVLLQVAVSAAVAYVLHLIVEKPALYLRDKLAP